ncbi:MAG: acyl--CoA ligase [Oscillospiraceae bacterium]|nr:acyl--CoA ligase [Oscillospiraceae bacterium]
MNLQEIFSKDNSIYETWKLCNADHADLPAIEYFGNQWTFKETDEMIDIYARAFMSMLPDRTRTVTFCVPTLPSTLFAFYALNKIGIRAQFVSHTILPSDPKEYIDETDTEILFLFDGFFSAVAGEIVKTNIKNIVVVPLSDGINTISDYVTDDIRPLLHKNDSVQKIKAALPHLNIIALDDFVSVGKQSTEAVKSVYNKGDTAVVLYTGGSTGIPKGVEKTNEEFIDMARIYLQANYFDYKTRDRNLILIPPNHPTSFVLGCVVPWFIGTTQVLQPIYSKDNFANDLYYLKAQSTIAAPSHFATLPLCNLPDGALSHVRILFCGGELVTPELATAVNKTLKRLKSQSQHMVVGYGMAELGPLTHLSYGVPELLNRVGKPIPEVIARIVDDNGNILGDNTRGNLEIKSPCRMKGYFKQPELTKAFFTEDGFAKTGDIAVRDENGYYDVLGRASDSIIMSDGSKVYLFDIERVVYKDPAVLECEVVGLEIGDKKEPIVHIVLNPEYIGKNDEVILRAHKLCREHLSVNEMPRAYKIREAFGTNPISTKRDYRSLLSEHDGYYEITGDSVRAVRF